MVQGARWYVGDYMDANTPRSLSPERTSSNSRSGALRFRRPSGGGPRSYANTDSANSPQLPEVHNGTNRTQQTVIAVAVGVLGLGTYLWQLTVPIFLQLYDSGVYVASAIHLVSGILPYREFSFVQPPGILLLLSPIAVISRIFGSHDGFILARVLTALVTATNASLLAWLVRHRGRVAMVFAGGGLALTPVAVFFSSGVRLEPYCFFFVLLGSLKISNHFDRSSLSVRPLVVGGLLFGVAAVVEFWAFFPFLAMMICLLPHYRRRVVAFIFAAGCGLVLPSLPFFIGAPRNIISDLFTGQLHHPRSGGGLLRRVVDLTGFSGTSIAPNGTEALVGIGLFALLVVIAFRRKATREFGDFFLLLAACIAVVGLLAAPAAYTDYGYFAAPFLFGLLGVSVGRLLPSARVPIERVNLSSFSRRFLIVLSSATVAIVTFAVVAFVTTFYSVYLPLTGVSATAISDIASTIPAGSCVIYDTVGMGLLANRFQSHDARCPTIVDPFGFSMAWGYQTSTPAREYVARWRTYLTAAKYLVVAVPLVETPKAVRELPYQGMIPWDLGLESWFKRHYHLVSCEPDCIYVHE